MRSITADDFRRKLESEKPLVIDVRGYDEYAHRHVAGAVSIPVDELAAHADRVPKDRPVYLICQSGNRSSRACEILEGLGLDGAVSVSGGMAAYEKAGGKTLSLTGVIPLMRQVQIAAGFLVLSGVVLSYLVHPAFRLLSGAVGAGLLFAGLTGFCGMALLLAKMPWNKTSRDEVAKTGCCGG